MTDYLQKIVAKNLGQTELIRPKLPAMFEPNEAAEIPISTRNHTPEEPNNLNKQNLCGTEIEPVSSQFMSKPPKSLTATEKPPPTQFKAEVEQLLNPTDKSLTEIPKAEATPTGQIESPPQNSNTSTKSTDSNKEEIENQQVQSTSMSCSPEYEKPSEPSDSQLIINSTTKPQQTNVHQSTSASTENQEPILKSTEASQKVIESTVSRKSQERKELTSSSMIQPKSSTNKKTERTLERTPSAKIVAEITQTKVAHYSKPIGSSFYAPQRPSASTPAVQITIGRLQVEGTLSQPIQPLAKSSLPQVMRLNEYLKKRSER